MQIDFKLKMYRSSYSQHSIFEQCNRQWFLSYVRKIPTIQDMSYLNAGKVLHDIIDEYYKNNQNLEQLKILFIELWKKKKLDDGLLKLKMDEYWGMVLNVINLKIKLTSAEYKIYYPEVIAYLDGINTYDDIIVDWKSSTRTLENEEGYKKQILLYSWLYHRKFSKIPIKSTVYFLKYIGEKGKLEFKFTIEEIKQIEEWYNNILQQMEIMIIEGKLPPKCNTCNQYCPYMDLCENNQSEGKLKYTLHINGNYIQVEGLISTLLNKGLKNKFSYELKDSYYIKKHNPNARTTVEFWNPKVRKLPIGFKDELIKTLKNYCDYKKAKLILDIKDWRKFNSITIKMPEKFINNKELRDYQLEAIDVALRDKIGILEIGTGGGKTHIAAEIIRRLGIKTLFVVDKIELLLQTKKVLEESLGLEVGVIRGKEQNIKDITVATIQTLRKNLKQFKEYLNSIRLVIFDECHKVAAKSYWKLGQYLVNTEYRYGLSGTAYRDDGNDMLINAVSGYIVYNLGGKQLIDKGWLVKPTISFIRNYIKKEEIISIESSLKIGLINETLDYNNSYLEFIQNNERRNNIVHDIVNKHNGKKILILTKLIEHGTILNTLIINSKHLYGGTNIEERKQMLEDFKNNKLNILISTISIFSEGVDLPNLDVVINVGANKGDVKTIQMLGRVLRKLEGKENCFYYDFFDNYKFFNVASLKRKRALQREEHDVKYIDLEKQNI